MRREGTATGQFLTVPCFWLDVFTASWMGDDDQNVTTDLTDGVFGAMGGIGLFHSYLRAF